MHWRLWTVCNEHSVFADVCLELWGRRDPTVTESTVRLHGWERRDRPRSRRECYFVSDLFFNSDALLKLVCFACSLHASFTSLSGSETALRRLRRPCATRTQKRTIQMGHSTLKSCRPPETSCSALKHARNFCTLSLNPLRISLLLSGISCFYHFCFVMSVFVSYCDMSCKTTLNRMNSDTVDYEDAGLIVRYLASTRPFSQSFDIYLTQVMTYWHESFKSSFVNVVNVFKKKSN